MGLKPRGGAALLRGQMHAPPKLLVRGQIKSLARQEVFDPGLGHPWLVGPVGRETGRMGLFLCFHDAEIPTHPARTRFFLPLPAIGIFPVTLMRMGRTAVGSGDISPTASRRRIANSNEICSPQGRQCAKAKHPVAGIPRASSLANYPFPRRSFGPRFSHAHALWKPHSAPGNFSGSTPPVADLQTIDRSAYHPTLIGKPTHWYSYTTFGEEYETLHRIRHLGSLRHWLCD